MQNVWLTKNEKEINIAVAKTIGYAVIQEYNSLVDGRPVKWWRQLSNAGTDCTTENLPDYCGSLDAIVPLIRALPPLVCSKAVERLFNNVKGYSCLATAREYAVSYLEAKGVLP